MTLNIDTEHKYSFRTLFILAAATAVFLIAVGFIFKAMGYFEMPLSVALNNLHHGVLGTIGSLFYKDFGPAPAVIGTALITGLIFLVKRDLRVATTFAFTVAGTWLSVAVVKMIVDRPRPDASILPFPYHPIQTDASYPSGHAAFVAALVVVAVLLFAQGTARKIAAIVGAVIILIAVFLLAVDGVHYLSDAVASVVWVLGVAPLVRAVWIRWVMPRIPFLRHSHDA